MIKTYYSYKHATKIIRLVICYAALGIQSALVILANYALVTTYFPAVVLLWARKSEPSIILANTSTQQDSTTGRQGEHEQGDEPGNNFVERGFEAFAYMLVTRHELRRLHRATQLFRC